MIFRQFIHDDLGCASYLVGDEHAGVVAVVDPQLEIEGYVAQARYFGVRIEHILETHNHADHVSGHGRLAAATGATIHIHRLAQPDYDHEPFDEGWELQLGSVTVRALHTPGHRPEHTAFAVIDAARGPEPWAVLTGDTLFVGDIARPDLAVDKEEGAHAIFRSLHRTVLALPGECEVWPGHLGGSLCGGPGMDMKVSSTIAFERRHNPLLAVADEEAFVREATAELGPKPPNFEAIVEINRGPLLTALPEFGTLTTDQLAAKAADGALIVDVRTDLEFDEGHIPGAVCNPAERAGFGTKLGWVAGGAREVMLVGRGDSDAILAARLSAPAGVRGVTGYLSGGMPTWIAEGRLTESIARLDVAALHARGDEVQILDVRERAEWEEGHIPGSVHIPYHDIAGVPDGIDPERPVAVICSSGQRSAVAASLLLRHGVGHVSHVTNGGVGNWEQSGWPIERVHTITAV